MSDANASANTPPPPGPMPVAAPPHPPFPIARLLYAFFFGLIAWFVLHVIFVLAVVQFVLVAINGRPHDELGSFSASLIEYEKDLLAYITFVHDAPPFPFGLFPKSA
jgi:uncharacterized protein DUF4389